MTTKVKICGLRDVLSLDAALDAGADYIGLVHFPRSPRHLSVTDAARLARHAHARSTAKVVALLVDPSDELVDAVTASIEPDVIQLHGHESAARVAQARARAGCAIWKAVPVATKDDVSASAPFREPGRASMILFDAKPPASPGALPGGNGLSFDWRILEGLREPFILAGGLTPENVADAVRLVAPYAVDVSSGVETAPGEKSPELIRRFIQAVKGAKG